MKLLGFDGGVIVQGGLLAVIAILEYGIACDVVAKNLVSI